MNSEELCELYEVFNKLPADNSTTV